MQATVRTMVLMLCATVIAVLLGWTYAFVCERLVRRGRFFWRMVPIISISLPLFIHAAAWEATAGKFGWLAFSSIGARSDLFSGAIASAWIHGVTGAAWVALIVGSVLRSGFVAGELASQLEASVWRSAVFVIAPATYSAVVASGLWVALIAATEISVVDLYGYRTLADEVYFQYALSPEPLPILLATLLPVAISVSLVIWIWLCRHAFHRPIRCMQNGWSTIILPTSGRVQIAATVMMTSLAALMVALPLVSLLIKAGWTVERSADQWVARWTASQATATIFEAVHRFGVEYYWTGMLALTVIAITLPLSMTLAWIGRRHLKPVVVGCVLLLFIPGPVISVAIMQFFSQSDLPWLTLLYDQTLIPTAIAVLYRSVPLCCFVLMVAHNRSNRRIDEASAIDGLNIWQHFAWIEIPRLRAPAAICCLVAGVIAVGEISATELVLPPGVSTVSRRVFGLLHSGVRYQESGLCLISSTLLIGVILAFNVIRFTFRPKTA